MKTYTFTSVAVAFLVVTATASGAISGGPSGPEDYLVERQQMRRWSVGLTYQDQRRQMKDGFATAVYKIEHTTVCVGYNPVPWVTLYGTLGTCHLQPGIGRPEGDDDFEWSAGLRARLLYQDIAQPISNEDQVRIDANASYGSYRSEVMGADVDWEEIRASLTLGYTARLLESVHWIFPRALTLSGGPVFSDMSGTYGSGWSSYDIEEDDPLGLLLVLDVDWTQNFSFQYEYQKFEEVTHSVGVSFRF